MFNYDNRCRFSDFNELGKLFRDAEFFGVGKLLSRVPRRVVPITSARAAIEISARPNGIAAVICSPELVDRIPEDLGCIVHDRPFEAAHSLHSQLSERAGYYWTDFPSRVASSARIAASACIAAQNVIVEEDAVIDEGVIIGERVRIGRGSYIGAGSIVGSRAFELVSIGGRNVLQTQAGGVSIGSHAILLSGVAVARSIFATFTDVGDNAAIDNLVHVAHDCVIAHGAQVTAGAILAGRVVVEADSYIGPNATVSNGVTVGENAAVTIGSTVIRDVDSGSKVTGNFAIDHRTFMRKFKGEQS